MNKNLKAITLVMENCEIFTIPYMNVLSISIEKIHESYFNIANTVTHSRTCKALYLQLDSTAALLFGKLEQNKQLYKRVMDNDITHVELIFDDDSTDYITIKWSNKKQYENLFQKVEISDIDASIKIVIKKNKKK